MKPESKDAIPVSNTNRICRYLQPLLSEQIGKKNLKAF